MNIIKKVIHNIDLESSTSILWIIKTLIRNFDVLFSQKRNTRNRNPVISMKLCNTYAYVYGEKYATYIVLVRLLYLFSNWRTYMYQLVGATHCFDKKTVFINSKKLIKFITWLGALILLELDFIKKNNKYSMSLNDHH